MRTTRHECRLKMGEAALFSLNRAAQLLPWSDSRARKWLMDRGLVRHIDGRPVVRWRDVLEALDDGTRVVVNPAPKRAPLPRVKL